MSAGDDLVEEMSGLRTIVTLGSVEAELIQDEKVPLGV